MKAVLMILLLALTVVVVLKQPWVIAEWERRTRAPHPAVTAPQQPLSEELRQRMSTLENRLAHWESRRTPPAAMGSVAIKKGDPDWKLTDLFSRSRQYRQRILFAHPFAHPPHILLGITLLDLPGEKIRFHARPEEIDTQGFTLTLETRSEARLEEIHMDWIAVDTTPPLQAVP
ncbi:MAG: H-type lectin domain-containing protein [Magnetococcales bacterium]|nr:H-type lectin domain-containing protein [Magnetococcales bacterium]